MILAFSYRFDDFSFYLVLTVTTQVSAKYFITQLHLCLQIIIKTIKLQTIFHFLFLLLQFYSNLLMNGVFLNSF